MSATLTEAPQVSESEEATEAPKATQLPLFEGCRVTKYTVNFGGNVEIGDLDLIKKLKLNGEAELSITVRVASRGHKVSRDGEGNVTGTISSSNLVVESITLADD